MVSDCHWWSRKSEKNLRFWSLTAKSERETTFAFEGIECLSLEQIHIFGRVLRDPSSSMSAFECFFLLLFCPFLILFLQNWWNLFFAFRLQVQKLDLSVMYWYKMIPLQTVQRFLHSSSLWQLLSHDMLNSGQQKSNINIALYRNLNWDIKVEWWILAKFRLNANLFRPVEFSSESVESL